MKKGDLVRIRMSWAPYSGAIGIVMELCSYETAQVAVGGWGLKHLDCEVLEVISEEG